MRVEKKISTVLFEKNHEKVLAHIIEESLKGWRDSSAVKSTDCSSRGPGFNSQHPHGSKQLSVTPRSHTLTHTCRQNTNANKMKIFFKKRIIELTMIYDLFLKFPEASKVAQYPDLKQKQ